MNPPPDAPLLNGRDVLVLSPTPTFPLNAGNRKRIHRICSELQRRGARVHFVYYPFEWPDTYVPQQHLDAMARQWDSFHLVPVTRSLQSPPAGFEHTIDEWWDAAAIEPMLHWLLHRGCYDAFIVNYAYLSRALEFASPRTLKILDTHDRFTGRREVLRGMGLAPEYFYTSADEERRALDRADLVWAIKDEEAAFFRTLTQRPVITMPHADPAQTLAPRAGVADADELVLGMVGADNSVNHRNAMLFIEQVLPVLRRQLAPVKIRFGGGMCDRLAALESLPTGVELAGRFGRAEDFYGSVDAVLVPLAHSTGLKIKAVEAFSLGLPVIAHRHAVEGIPVTHPFHRCDSAQQIADCCIELAFDRSRLVELAQATRDTCARLRMLAGAAMDDTVGRIVERPVIVLAAAPEMVLFDTFYGRQLRETLDYLKHLADIVFFVDRPLAGAFELWCRTFSWRASGMKIVFSPAAAAAMGLGAQRKDSAPFPLFHSVETFAALCARLHRAQVWLLDLPAELATASPPVLAMPRGYLRLDTLRALGRWSDAELAALLQRHGELTAVANFGAFVDPVVAQVPSSQLMTVPVWRRSCLWDDVERTRRDGPVWVATTVATLPWAVAVWRALRGLWPERVAPRLVWPGSEDAAARDATCLDAELARGASTDALAIDQAYRQALLPVCVVDTTGAHPLLTLLHETLSRAGVPVLPAALLDAAANQPSLLSGAAPATVADLVQAVVAVVEHGRPAPDADTAYLSDAGWQAVWKAASAHSAIF